MQKHGRLALSHPFQRRKFSDRIGRLPEAHPAAMRGHALKQLFTNHVAFSFPYCLVDIS